MNRISYKQQATQHFHETRNNTKPTATSVAEFKNIQISQNRLAATENSPQIRYNGSTELPNVMASIETNTTRELKRQLSSATGTNITDIPIFAANCTEGNEAVAMNGKQIVLNNVELVNRSETPIQLTCMTAVKLNC